MNLRTNAQTAPPSTMAQSLTRLMVIIAFGSFGTIVVHASAKAWSGSFVSTGFLPVCLATIATVAFYYALKRTVPFIDASAQARILSALERFAATGEGDVRPLRGEFAGSYRLRVGKWRVFVLLEGTEIIAYQVDNRGEAY